MTPFVILDTGPLVAALNRNDAQHKWAVRQLRQAGVAFISCEAVMAEATFLLGRAKMDLQPLLDFVEQAPVQFPLAYGQNIEAIRRLLISYADVPMSFADACLVRLSELYGEAPLITLDSDFRIYRRNRSQVLPAIIPA